MNHSPAKCAICGEYHCLAGCVPLENCKKKLAEQIGDDRLHYQKGNHHVFTNLEGNVTLEYEEE